MQRRPYGTSGEHLSVIGFGGIVVSQVEASEADRLVGQAVERGVNYFDVAPSYGNAEERLGTGLGTVSQRCILGLQDDPAHAGWSCR